MSGGVGSLVEWTNRTVHLAEGAAHLAHLGGTAGRLAKRLPQLGVLTGASQAGFFYAEALDAFAEQGKDSDQGWEAVGGSLIRVSSTVYRVSSITRCCAKRHRDRFRTPPATGATCPASS